MFIQGQDLVKELVKHFPFKDFSWIDDILSEEENKSEGGVLKILPLMGGMLEIFSLAEFLL